jgi:hypothetical protein
MTVTAATVAIAEATAVVSAAAAAGPRSRPSRLEPTNRN